MSFTDLRQLLLLVTAYTRANKKNNKVSHQSVITLNEDTGCHYTTVVAYFFIDPIHRSASGLH